MLLYLKQSGSRIDPYGSRDKKAHFYLALRLHQDQKF